MFGNDRKYFDSQILMYSTEESSFLFGAFLYFYNLKTNDCGINEIFLVAFQNNFFIKMLKPRLIISISL